jgi:DNA invertase Pin-like site-specific DNA recombinase
LALHRFDDLFNRGNIAAISGKHLITQRQSTAADHQSDVDLLAVRAMIARVQSWCKSMKTLNHLERLNGYGVNYRSFTEQYLDSTGMFKEAVIGILAAVAKQERVRLSERTIAGLERAKADGRVGGRPKAEEAEPKLLAKVSRLRSEGHSVRAIALEVKKSPNTILRLLKSGQVAD